MPRRRRQDAEQQEQQEQQTQQEQELNDAMIDRTNAIDVNVVDAEIIGEPVTHEPDSQNMNVDMNVGMNVIDENEINELAQQHPGVPNTDWTVKERQRQAVMLKSAGVSYAGIAQRLGYANPSSARAAVMSGLVESLQVEGRVLKAIQHQRYEQIIGLHWPDVLKKDRGAAALVMSAMDRINNLYGLPQEITNEEKETIEGVLVIDGGKNSYIDALRKARKSLNSGEKK